MAMMAVRSAVGRGRWWWLPYVYLLRVQIITGTLLVFGPVLALRSSILNGLFDLDYGSPFKSGTAMAVVSLAAFLTAWTLLASSVTTLLSAKDRFGTEEVHWVRFPIRWPEREAFGGFALFAIGAALTHSWQASGVDRRYLAGGALVGMAVAVVVLLVANKLAARLYRDIYDADVHQWWVRALRWAIAWVDRDNVREGFIDPNTNRIYAWHLLAWVVFLASLAFYGGIGVYKWFYLGFASVVSTLAYALLLMILLCWFFGGLAFFFDRYRVPILALVVALLTAVGIMPFNGNDHTYRTWPSQNDRSPSAADVLLVGDHRPILIAATGGGIQAAAWTARVLTGIDDALGPELGDRYVKAIRVMSTVSGGGVGAMYFSQRYRPIASGQIHFAHSESETIVNEAMTSSLDDVAWGVLYPDLLGLVYPPIRSWLGDRASAMEKAWTRTTTADENSIGAVLGQWRTQVWAAQRPANIFNATIVDSGDRLVLGTTRVGWVDKQPGMRNFEDDYRNRDIQIVTAARLAASFTYVSPAARADFGAGYHVVDGGYYDDYGMTTLIEWLDEALEQLGRPADGGLVDRVLVIQLQSSPPERLPPAGDGGTLYQTAAPLETLLNVRTTGQRSHNDEEFGRLQRLWSGRGVEIDNVVFRFCGEHPPLSWHLTGREKQNIQDSWKAEANGPGITAIRQFFANEPIVPAIKDHPFDAKVSPCSASK